MSEPRSAFQRAAAVWRSQGFGLYADLMVLGGGQLATKLIGFAAFAYLARILDPAGYGAMEYIIGLSVFFAALIDGGGSVGMRRVAHDPSTLPKMAFQILMARLLIAALVTPIMVIVALSAKKAGAPPTLIWLFAASLLLAPWRQEWLLQTKERLLELAASQVVRAAVFTAMVILLLKDTHHLPLVGWAELVSVGAMTLFCLVVQHWRITPFRLRGSFNGFLDLLKEGVVISSANMLYALTQTIPLLFIGHFAGAVEVALFAAGARLVGAIMAFPQLYHYNLLRVVMFARAADLARMSRLLSHSFRVVGWLGVLAAVGLTLFAEPIVRLTFGAKLVEAAPFLAIMSWSLPIALWAGHSRSGLIASGEQGRVLWAHIAGLVAILVLCPLLGYAFGAIGYALAATIGPLAVWICTDIFAALKGHEPPSVLMGLRPLLLGLIVVAVCHFLGLGFWSRAAAVAGFVVAAPILDPKLIADLIQLGRSKVIAAPEPPATA